MVSPAEWGPSTWELLHGIAERVGNQKSLVLIRDEKNELRIVLRTLGALLPCKLCQGHYKLWIQRHPPDTVIEKGGEYLQDALREWFYQLHEDVNQRREVNSGITLDTLKDRYKNIDLRANANILKYLYNKALQSRVIHPTEWKDAWRHLDLLLRFIGA